MGNSGEYCSSDLGGLSTWCETKGIIFFLEDEDVYPSAYAVDKTVEGDVKDILIKMSFIKIGSYPSKNLKSYPGKHVLLVKFKAISRKAYNRAAY